MLPDLTIRSYLDRVAADEPAPGGGSVTALTGALGSSLLAMVGNFTAGREKFKDVEAEVRAILDEEARNRAELVELIQADADAYACYARAQALPRATDDEKASRRKAMREALIGALRVPVRIMELAGASIRLADRLADAGNPNLVSDAGVAASLSAAALECGWLNVEINLAWLRDPEVSAQARARTEPLLAQGRRAAAAVWEKVRAKVVRD